jgi:hypothetical protein
MIMSPRFAVIGVIGEAARNHEAFRVSRLWLSQVSPFPEI